MAHSLPTGCKLWTRPLLVVFVVTAAGACQSSRPVSSAPQAAIPWTDLLPSCPCTRPHAEVVGDGWAQDAASCTKKHPGAGVCFRSYPTVKTGQGRSGQQCCYDDEGLLITSGSGAGTPDRMSSCRGEKKNGKMKVRLLGLLGHVAKDVRPWSPRLKSWQVYHENWPPDNTNRCSEYYVTQHKGGVRVTSKAEPLAGAASDRLSPENQTSVSPRGSRDAPSQSEPSMSATTAGPSR